MKKLSLLLLIVLVAFTSGCGAAADKNANAMEIKKDGSVTVTSVSSFDKKYYSADELKEEAQAEIKAYNEKAGEEKIKLRQCSAGQNTARIVIFYSSYKDYCSFNNSELYIGTLQSALDEGIADSGTSVLDSDQDLRTTLGELARKKTTYGFIKVTEGLLVRTPGKIVYVSQGTSLDKDGNAQAGGKEDTGSVLESPCYIIYEE